MFVDFKTTFSASSINVFLNKDDVSRQPCSKCLGGSVDSKLLFMTDILKLESKSGRNCRVVTNMRLFVPIDFLIKINSVISKL